MQIEINARARKLAAIVAWVFICQLMIGIVGGVISVVLSSFGLPGLNMEKALPGVLFFSLVFVGVGAALGLLPGTEKRRG